MLPFWGTNKVVTSNVRAETVEKRGFRISGKVSKRSQDSFGLKRCRRILIYSSVLDGMIVQRSPRAREGRWELEGIFI